MSIVVLNIAVNRHKHLLPKKDVLVKNYENQTPPENEPFQELHRKFDIFRKPEKRTDHVMVIHMACE